jgi:hypothetical protein
MLERPVLKQEDLPYREAFFLLNDGRTQGAGGFDPLATSEILALVVMGGIAYIGDKPKYLRLMRQLDRTYLEHQAEKAPKK